MIYVQVCDCGKHPRGFGWTENGHSAEEMWDFAGPFKEELVEFSDDGLVVYYPGMKESIMAKCEGHRSDNSKFHPKEVELPKEASLGADPWQREREIIPGTGPQQHEVEDKPNKMIVGPPSHPMVVSGPSNSVAVRDALVMREEPKANAALKMQEPWFTLAVRCGGAMALAKSLSISYMTLRKVVRRGKSGNPDLVRRVNELAASKGLKAVL